MVYQAYGGTNNPSQALTSDQNRKIFLGGLSYHTTDETLRSFCSRFGTITDCLVMRNPEGKSRGFGFVTYEDTTSVEEFMRSRPHTIDNRQIDPKRAMPREDQNSSDAHLTVKKLFVAGLREGINEENLRQYFSRYGNVTEVLIMKDRDGKPRGFAFVSFDDYDAVDKAILEKPHTLNGRNLDVKKAVPKEKMPEGGGSGSGGGGGGSSYNSGNSSNYGMSDTSGSGGGAGRNSYGSIRDNFGGGGGGGGSGGGSWDNQGGMPRMNNPNQSYNQQQASYQQQQGYNSGSGGYNSAAVASGGSGGYPQSYSSMGQNQQQPPQPMMSYEAYNSSTNMPFNASNQSSSTGYIQPSQPSYGQNQQQQPAFGGSGNGFGGNLPFNSSQQQPASTGGYNTGSSMPSAFDNSDSYGIISQNYGGSTGSGNYNNMQQQQPRGGGPMRGGRGGGGNYSGSGGYGNSGGNNSSSNYGNRPAPYSTRGGRGGGGGSGGGGPSYYNNRGRGRGQ